MTPLSRWHSTCTSTGMIICLILICAKANPDSKPYVPFRTDPFDQDNLHHKLEWEEDVTKSQIRNYDPPSATTHNEHCPLQFSLGISSRSHKTNNAKGLGIVEPPIIYPILPSEGPGRQVLYTTQYEHLDMLTPVKGQQIQSEDIKEGLIQHVEFPLLFESSSFLTSPIIGDVNQDGVPDAILTDYDGGIYAIGLQVEDGKRWFHRTQVPRIYIRRKWMESFVNETLGIEAIVSEDEEEKEDEEPNDRSRHIEKPHDPYHTHFEYMYGTPSHHEEILRGVPANVIGQDKKQVTTLEERRKRQIQHHPDSVDSVDETHRRLLEVVLEKTEEHRPDSVDITHRRLQEVAEEQADVTRNLVEEVDAERVAAAEQIEEGVLSEEKQHYAEGREEEHVQGKEEEPDQEHINGEGAVFGDDQLNYIDDLPVDDIGIDDHNRPLMDDVPPYDDYYQGRHYGDDNTGRTYEGDDEYGKYDDYHGRYYHSEHDEYYDDKHYVRVPPHILCTPTLMEFPKLYSNEGESEYLLFVAVSYYMDEDEYEGFFSYKRFDETDTGDDTEVHRGMYVANAIMVYQFSGSNPRWGRQEHLDLSGDHSAPVNATLVGSIPLRQENTKMGAFALSSPTVADIDGDGNMEVLMGTSMGIVYCVDGRNLYKKENWPVQFQHPVESRILVEDVRGDTDLEIFVADVAGNVVCLDSKANKIWHRDLIGSTELQNNAEVLASSQMVLGDIDGDGVLDIVVAMKLRTGESQVAHYLFAVSADTGGDIPNFPVRIGSTNDEHQKEIGEEFVVGKLPAPLLVDLHGDQSFLNEYIRRNGTKWTRPFRRPTGLPLHGGSANGLHIVLPIGSNLVIMEAGSGCSQSIAVGDDILTMVQADDVHGTNSLDLVITTASGNIVTLESKSPYHPLNVWNNGESRGRVNAAAHGYSASQGIFVHDVSRQFRDIFGVWIPITFEIFDNRPNIMNEPDRRVYNVEFREGIATIRFRKTYSSTGVYTERMYIPNGPGYYSVTVMLKSTHGIVYEDTFHIGYNVNYMEGFGMLLWVPLLVASFCILVLGTRVAHWDEDDYEVDGQDGILGSPLPE